MPQSIPPLTPLVVRFGRLGDMVLQAPILHLLHRRYGLPCRLLGSGDWPAPLFAASKDVAEIMQLRGRHTPFLLSPQRWHLVAALRRHAGPVYVTEDIPRAVGKIRALLTLAGIAPAQTVFIDEMTQRPEEHWVDRLLRFGCTTPAAFEKEDYPFVPGDFRPAPQLAASAADRADRDAWLRQRGFGDRPIVLLQTGNKRSIKWGRQRRNDPKAWPEQYWIALLQEMHRRLPSAVLLLCGSPREFSMLEALRNSAQMESVATAAKDLPLGRLLALCEIAHCMVSVDSGPAHLAAAVGCPLVVLYGAESPQRWDRRSPSGRPVINLGGPPHTTSVGDIALTNVIDAWQEVLRWHDYAATQRNARSSAYLAVAARTR